MSPSFDFSSLLCEEEEDDYSTLSDGERVDATWHHQDRRPANDFSGGDWLPVQSDECVMVMVKKEIEHSPESDYLCRLRSGDLDLVSRKEAIHWISKVVAQYNFGPVCAYLAVSYLDRFLSVYDSSKGQAWLMQLLGVACLSLAAKMEENEVPLSLDLQVSEAKFVFEAKTIQRMELVVLSTLKWRMQAITPFSFIDNFVYKINGEKYPPQSVISQSSQLIFSIIKGIEFLEFRPSEIAAAVAISVGLEAQTVEVDKSIHLLTEYVQKDRVLQCLEMINESSFKRGLKEGQSGNLTPSVPHSPIGVLGITLLSYKSDDSPVGSCASSPHISHGTKRRKLLV